MKKLILILCIAMISQVSWACIECQGAIEKGKTPPKYQRNSWRARLSQAEENFDQMWKEHQLMYRMISELYIKRMGYKKYEALVLTPMGKSEEEK